MRPESKASDAQQMPSPKGGWSSRVEVLRNPVIVPPRTRSFVQEAGILRANGSYCAQGALWRKARPLTLRPEPPQKEIREMAGAWLWGGVMWRHFGHFLVESTGRFWPLMAMPEDIRGVLFVPKSPEAGTRLEPYQREFLRLCGIQKARVLSGAARPEKLYVPGQGFGLGEIVEGTEHTRRWFRDHFAPDIGPEGPERLYISRSGLNSGRAKLLCEDQLDRHLAAQGYEVFHPQQHDIRTQIARYRAARDVIACEGSAIHLFAMVARPHQRLAIMVRRMSSATQYIAQHVASFGGLEPVVVDAITGGWLPEGKGTRRHQVSALDFAKAQVILAGAGFVEPDPAWDQPSENEMEAALAASFEEPLVQVDI